MDVRDTSNRYSSLEKGLIRTFSPKYANYFGDGSGRLVHENLTPIKHLTQSYD